jgi:hypothetical protein
MASGDDNAKELCRREEKAFGNKANLDALHQELALNFYPERADFTTERSLGEEFAIDIMDSEPLRCRRDLGNARASMLRPRGNEWFKAKLADDALNEQPHIARALEQINKRARAAMYRARSGFVNAAKIADQDVVTFGGAIMTAEAARNRDGSQRLKVGVWHPRDCAYYDDEDGIGQDLMYRRFKASARHIKKVYPEANLSDPIKQALDKDPDKQFRLCHTMMRAEEYDYYKKPSGPKTEWVSIYYDSESKRILRERPSARFRYIVDKWGQLPDTQYPYSPAAITALPDARGIQIMAMVLLEAGEKSLDPPLKAAQNALKGDINSGAAGITWVDKNYDERTGPSIEPLFPDGFKPGIGIDLINRTTMALRDTWYLTKLTLPQQAKTAYETAQLVEEFIRANIPLFEPWEAGIERLLDEIFAVLIEIGEFGALSDLPPEFSGRELEFAFSNPLQDAIERNKVNQFQTALGLAAGVREIDQGALHGVDWSKGLTDAVRGAGAPADWLVDEDAANAKRQADGQVGDIVGAINTAGQAAEVANTGLEAAQKLRDLTQPAADGTAAYGPT